MYPSAASSGSDVRTSSALGLYARGTSSSLLHASPASWSSLCKDRVLSSSAPRYNGESAGTSLRLTLCQNGVVRVGQYV